MRWQARGLNELGLTLIETIIALAILTVGLTTLAAAVPAAFKTVHSGRQSSTAVFLASQRLEEIKAFVVSPNPARGLINVTELAFPAEPYAAIPDYPGYRREVEVLELPTAPADTRVVQVRVFYRPIGEAGRMRHETAVTLATLFASR